MHNLLVQSLLVYDCVHSIFLLSGLPAVQYNPENLEWIDEVLPSEEYVQPPLHGALQTCNLGQQQLQGMRD